MSIAGIRSNRGDIYQTLVAFDWALTVLSDQNFEWLEVDATTYSVDDVVIGKSNGDIIACQCKKNQIDFKSWTITDLGDEIDKACHLLSKYSNAQIRFYSRNNFGELAKLKEYSSTQPDEASYQENIKHNNIKTSKKLNSRIEKHNISEFEFLRRISFNTTEELERMKEFLDERLRNLVSNSRLAFGVLWTELDHLGARNSIDNSTSPLHRLTKKDLKEIISKAGATLTPPMNVKELKSSFSRTSAIGRYWQRDIEGTLIPRPLLQDILHCIAEKQKSILLTGLPGVGKTCIMLTLQEELERQAKANSGIVPLFIQSYEFADLTSSEDRKAHGLSEMWVEEAARLSEEAHVVILIDSLDVLSIARDHYILKYFLAQIDRLILIPNITIITACRDFDKRYDRQISKRQWDVELECVPLDWATEIEPLLKNLGIKSSDIDSTTRELISIPRELSVFVELALQGSIFNVVTSQSLAQKYIDTLVQANTELGDVAIMAIENMATEMLRTRSLSIPHQRLNAPINIQRKLCSLNIIKPIHNDRLTFGHQTLLDALVMSKNKRNGVTLYNFIINLPPVPFVRPSIRNFVIQLSTGERSELRKQIRAVLYSDTPFHIKRLIAETLAEQNPDDGDWVLIHDLHKDDYKLFQIIYNSGRSIKWHKFWLKHLIPNLIMSRNTYGLIRHIHHISQWSNQDCTTVIAFWTDMIALEWLDTDSVISNLSSYLSKIETTNINLVVPLLNQLLTLPNNTHDYLGKVIANCITAGAVDDKLLWEYITKNVNNDNLSLSDLNKQLRCYSYNFKNGKSDYFITQHMKKSSNFLDLAVNSVEQWGEFINKNQPSCYSSQRYSFLSKTSYQITHSGSDKHYSDNTTLLFKSIESAILHHSEKNTEWWINNRKNICFSHENSLIYFGILALTMSPTSNIDLISKLLYRIKTLSHNFNYELGNLIKKSYIHLTPGDQEKIIAILIDSASDVSADHYKNLKKDNIELISTIPCHLRSPKAQEILNQYKRENGDIIRRPYIYSTSGFITPPFLYDKFLDISDSVVLKLLKHYANTSTRTDNIDSLIGGKPEVSQQLQEASSRNPTRFLNLISYYWDSIDRDFRHSIIDGVGTHLAYLYGNLIPTENWEPIEKPDAHTLVNQVLDELEKHSSEWQERNILAKLIKSCANVIKDTATSDRLVILSEQFLGHHITSPSSSEEEELIHMGINMPIGMVAEALTKLTIKLLDNNIPLPDLLLKNLRRFSNHEHPAVRAVILRYTPYLKTKSWDLGWEIFNNTIRKSTGLWKIAEPFMYYNYHDNPEEIKILLERITIAGKGKDLETWGRISALTILLDQNNLNIFLDKLSALDSAAAWDGAASVWSHPINIIKHRELCLEGLKMGLSINNKHALSVVNKMTVTFNTEDHTAIIPTTLIKDYFSVLEQEKNLTNNDHICLGFQDWLNKIIEHDIQKALDATEIFLNHIHKTNLPIYDHNNNFPQLLTRFFGMAEELEETDQGTMLQRVVAVQDKLLLIGNSDIVEWLKAAERP
tara:strand:- start:291 stop:4859 length:4569 start_codon:yes stop_codon:yes gene_type:complete